MKRPDCIRHWRDVEGADDATYPDSNERFSVGAPLAAGWVSAALVFTMNGCHPDAVRLIRMRKATKRSLFTFWRVTLRPGSMAIYGSSNPETAWDFQPGRACVTPLSTIPMKRCAYWWWVRPIKNITASTIRSIRCMPRRAKTAGSTIRLSFWAARWKTWAKIISSSINIDGRHILQQAGMEFNLRK